ncbi:MAG: type II toxin-antitoxin system prevent-host-death family antitoxin [Geminicoccaceae bacterium]
MDEAVSAAEANRRFSHILREVREGRTYVVTSHGRPVARIVPMQADDRVASEAKAVLLARLSGEPTVVIGSTWSRDDLYDE